MAKTLRERFETKYRIDPITGCWIWTSSKHSCGYGLISSRESRYKYFLAHRVSYELHKGPIPVGLCLDHLCRNRLCVNPEHLEAVTSGENVMRGIGFAPKNAARTHCINGHPFSEQNTVTRKEGWRVCRTCNMLRERQRRERKKAREQCPPKT